MPRYYVSDTWSDTQGHYWNENPSNTAWRALPAIQLDQPAAGHKRAFEDAQTGYSYVHGWFWAQGILLPSDEIYIDAYLGGYHGYDLSLIHI